MTMMSQSPDRSSSSQTESALQRALIAWIVTGLFFMLLPGTFLGVWNLISISNGQSLLAVPPAWIQAHGHAQIYGWVGSFILGIGFYSLSKMAGLAPFQVRRAWWAWALWSCGVGLRWWANIGEWHWRTTLPISAALELAAFILFFITVSRHRRAPEAGDGSRREPRPVWMLLVIASTFGFLTTLVINLAMTVSVAMRADGPAFPHLADQRLLTLALWGFLVPAIWGFNARWLPVFLGLRAPARRGLLAAYGLAVAGLLATLPDAWVASAVLTTAAAVTAALALHVTRRPLQPAKTIGVHSSFPIFIRVAYAWLVAGAMLSVWAAAADRTGGIWGASRHALTVGFIATMVFAIGQRALPAFCGMRVLYSPKLMFASLALLTLGCALRVATEPLAYQGYAPPLWPVLPLSALLEMAGVTLFALNIAITLLRPPEHLRLRTIQPAQSAAR